MLDSGVGTTMSSLAPKRPKNVKAINGIWCDASVVNGVPRARFYKNGLLLFDILVDKDEKTSPTIIIRSVEGVPAHMSAVNILPEVSNVVKIQQRMYEKSEDTVEEYR